jgi:uncharacterized membrane protein
MEEEQFDPRQLAKTLEGIMTNLTSLNDKLERQEARIEKLEITAGQETADSGVKASQVNVPVPPAPSYADADLEANKFNAFIAPAQPVEAVSMEENIGGVWFARIGITALVLGISFLLKYAFDNNWIDETGRVIIGIFIGLGLLGIGEKTIRKYFGYGQIITGGGIAILYLSIFAAFSFYSLIGQLPAFFFMILVTAIGIALSLRYDAYSLMVVATIGGFFTPGLLSNGSNNEIGLLSYVLLLDLAILAVSIFNKWRALNLIGFVGTGILFAGWGEAFYTRADLGMTMFFLTLFFVVFSISSVIFNLVNREKSTGIEQLMVLISATAYFAASYGLMNTDYHVFMGFFAILLGFYYFIGSYLIRSITAEDEYLYNFLVFLTVGFVTIAIPIQLERNAITIGWIVETLLLFFLWVKTKQEDIKTLGLAVFGLLMCRLLFLDSAHNIATDDLILNKTFLTFLFAIIIFYVTAYLTKLMQDKGDEKNFSSSRQMFVLFIIAANFLTIFAIGNEINFYYAKPMQVLIERENKLSDTGYNTNKINNLNNKSYLNNDQYQKETTVIHNEMSSIANRNSVALSIFGLIYGVILLIIGIAGGMKGARIGGIILLALAILKLFFFDLWNLGQLYRIISSITLGVVLLAISFAYQKYKDRLREMI